MKKFFILVLATTAVALSVSAQTKSVEIAKVNQGNWRVVEFINMDTGEPSSVIFYLRDSRYARIHNSFYISFDDRETLIDFLSELSKLYEMNEPDIHSQIYDYNILTGKVMGNNYITISDNQSSAYSSISKVYFNNLCKALKKKGYDIDFI